MNKRRGLLIVLGVASFVPQLMFAQTRKQPTVIGWLAFGSRESGLLPLAAFKEELAALGWRGESHIAIEERFADGREDRLPSLTRELVAKKPVLLVAVGLRAVINAVKGAPQIPIVMVSNNDPIAAGLVKSLSRPGGMITGLAGFTVDISAKYVELLLMAAPKVKRVGFLAFSNNPNHAAIIEGTRRAAKQYSVQALVSEAMNVDEVDPAMSRLVKDGAQALVVLPGALFGTMRRIIVKHALAQGWPVVAGPRAFAQDGALLSYDADYVSINRRAAHYVDRILKGAKPGDLPIEQPTTFELVVNMKTAKALGLTMPPEIMVRVSKVIE